MDGEKIHTSQASKQLIKNCYMLLTESNGAQFHVFVENCKSATVLMLKSIVEGLKSIDFGRHNMQQKKIFCFQT